jgi:hypothetical protein
MPGTPGHYERIPPCCFKMPTGILILLLRSDGTDTPSAKPEYFSDCRRGRSIAVLPILAILRGGAVFVGNPVFCRVWRRKSTAQEGGLQSSPFMVESRVVDVNALLRLVLSVTQAR